jgi:pyruvate dehydrogenase E2 component (dihydrolipoamide acetyltransferase)
MMASLRETAQVMLSLEADVTDLERAKEALKSRLHLTYTDLVVKAVALALAEHPRMNARMDPEGIRLVAEINVGVAVAPDERLVVPVIRNADRKRISEISGERTRLVRRAREGLLNQSEVTGGTFTVSNLGMYGIRVFTPIINSPEAAILGVGSIVERPTNREGDLIWRKMMTLSLTFDHRLVDGALAATFLGTLKDKLESPDWLPEGALEPGR